MDKPQVQSFKPFPLRIRGMHFSILDSRVLDCLGADVPKFINEMALFPTPLSDDELEEMTGEGFNSYAAMASYYNYITQ